MGHKIFILLLSVTGVLCGSSPHGAEYKEIFKQMGYTDPNIIEDANLDVIGLLNKYKYPSETHIAQTEDGYLLTMHRLWSGSAPTGKPVAFLMHGLLSSSADWINSGPNIGLGYLLADRGFDVWMGNARGNFYSKNHITLKPSESKFWKFSWNEIGYYDLPAMINKVTEITGQDKIHYAGHSQGTTSFFVMASQRPEFNKKIKSMHALAPVAYMGHLKSPLVVFLAPFADLVEKLTSFIGMNEFLPNTELMTIAGNMLCKDGSIFQPVCSNVLFLLCGFNPDLLNATMLPVYLGHTPAGAASRQFVHYAQEHMSSKFRKYDHGLLGNMAAYGTISPPSYSLKMITAPVALHYSDNDWMAEPSDVIKLYRELANPLGLFRVPHDKFNHLDFLWATKARELLYNNVVDLMEKNN